MRKCPSDESLPRSFSALRGRMSDQERAAMEADTLCVVHLAESGVRLGEVSSDHFLGEVVGIVLVEIEDLIERLEVDGALGLAGW